MSEFLTREETVTGMVHIYAVPSTDRSRAFDYRVTSYEPYLMPTSAVKVTTFEVSGVVPAGINLVERALETMEQKQREIQEKADREKERIEEEKQNLLMITHQPVEGGELVEKELPF